jgi:hypothetical protein
VEGSPIGTLHGVPDIAKVLARAENKFFRQDKDKDPIGIGHRTFVAVSPMMSQGENEGRRARTLWGRMPRRSSLPRRVWSASSSSVRGRTTACFQPMAIVDDAIEGGIGERWVANEAALATHGGEAYPSKPAEPAAHNDPVAGSSPASPTTHSHANRDFPWFDEYPAYCGGAGRSAVSAGKKDRLRGNSGPSVSGVQKPFPRSEGRSRSARRAGRISVECCGTCQPLTLVQ